MKPAILSILRYVGLLIEMAGLLAFGMLRNDHRAIAGIELRQLAFVAVALGFVLWIVSITARRGWSRRKPD